MLTKSLFSLSKNVRIPQCTSLFHSLISKKDKQKELIRMSQNIHNTDQETYLKKLEIASNFVKKNLGTSEIAMVLGTGLGPITNEMKDKVEIPFSEIPYMVSPSVLMHKGSLISGTISGKKVLALSGRIHPYEGYPEHLVFFNVQVMSECGCKLLFVTNAAGGGIKGMKPGDVMAITGHTTSNFQNLLTSIYNIPSLVPKSMNLEPIYSKRILKYAKQSAKKLGIKWFEGTYAMMQGPTFESHSEIDSGLALKTGAFGMSTGIETLAGKAAGMEIFGISFISNLAAGLEDGPLTHHDVLEVADEAGYKITQIVSDLVNTVPLLDRPEKNNREIECNQIVPVPIPVLPEQKEFDEAVSYLRSKIYFDPRVAVLLAPGHDEAFLRKLKCKREILYKDLPNFPLISPSSNKGKIVYGETENKIPILCLVGNDHKGLYDSEVTFLVKLFKDYGIESFGQTFLAGDLSYFENSNNQKPKARVMLTNDILNLVTFPDGILNDLEYESKAPQLFDEQFLNKMETIAKEKSINYTVGSLSSTTNCVLPIRSELEKYKNVGMSNLGLTNLTAILAARNLGIKTFSLADLCFDYSNYQDISIPKAIQDVKENSSEDIASLTISAIDQSINKNPNSQKRNDNHKSYTKYNKAKSAYDLPIFKRHSQGNYQDVRKASNYLKKKINEKHVINDFKYSMVVDDNVTEYELFEKKQLKILKKFKFSEIPFMSYKNLDGRENYNKYKDGEILICYSTEKKIPGIVFKIDSRQTHSKESLHEIRFALRMSNELGIKNIIFLNEVASGKESINNGDLVILRDLIDLSSENCLFGSNNEEWGTRFPDFSDPYQSNELNEIAKNSYIPAKQSVVSFVPDPIFDSPHLLQSSKYLKFDVSSAGSIYQTSVSRHMKMKVYALGLVHWDLKNNKIHYNSKENRDNASKNLNNLLSNLLIKKF